MFRGKLPVGGIALRRCAGMTSASAATGAAGLACATQFAVATSALGGSSTSATAWLMAAPCAAMRFDSHGGNYQDTKGPAREPIGTKRSGAYLLDKADVLARVLEVVKNFEKVDAAKVTPESHFINDLGLDSLDVVEVVMALEQEFVLDIPDHEAEKIQSIPDAVDYLAANPMAK